jgi:hypothetical protein
VAFLLLRAGSVPLRADNTLDTTLRAAVKRWQDARFYLPVLAHFAYPTNTFRVGFDCLFLRCFACSRYVGAFTVQFYPMMVFFSGDGCVCPSSSHAGYSSRAEPDDEYSGFDPRSSPPCCCLPRAYALARIFGDIVMSGRDMKRYYETASGGKRMRMDGRR